jgi:polysaccharide deacetylase 2 family uncharacterized protein YibQ
VARRNNPRRARTQGSKHSRRGAGAARPLLALLLLLGVVALIGYVVLRQPGKAPVVEAPALAPDLIARVASRHALSAESVFAERLDEDGVTLCSVTISVPKGFALDPFLLELEAEAHNLGGRLEPGVLLEGGGYGLARLEGTVAGERYRIVVIGEGREPTPGRASARPRSEPALLAIVLDDAGNSLEAARELGRLPRDVAIAVLPNTGQSTAVVQLLGGERRELLLHMPMETVPSNGSGPGPDGLDVGLSESEVAARLDRAFAVVPDARGVNNHMGSRATADLATMQALMAALHSREAYFLDSRTTPHSVAEQAARVAAVPVLRRDVFLDLVGEPSAIRRALGQAIARARSVGSAVAIGHVHTATIDVLSQELGRMPSDVELVTPSELIRRRAALTRR